MSPSRPDPRPADPDRAAEALDGRNRRLLVFLGSVAALLAIGTILFVALREGGP